MTYVENRFRYQNELFCAILLFGGPGRPASLKCGPSTACTLVTCQPGPNDLRAGPGQIDGLWAVLTGSGCLPKYSAQDRF